jgi:hypothetical protein
VDVAGSVIPFSKSVKILGVTLDPHLTFNRHVNQSCSSAHYHIRSLRHILSSLTPEMARTIVGALVGSCFDYSNYALFGATAANFNKLQSAQNSLARVVTCTGRYDSITRVLKQLHWLPSSYRIRFKLATLVFKTRSTVTDHRLQASERSQISTSCSVHHVERRCVGALSVQCQPPSGMTYLPRSDHSHHSGVSKRL